MLKKVMMLLLGIQILQASAVDLVRDGRGTAEIVLEPGTGRAAALGAWELQKHIRMMTGVTLPVVDRPGSGKLLPVYVGTGSAAAELGWTNEAMEQQEYRVEVRPRAIYLLGRDLKDGKHFSYEDVNTFPYWWDENGTLYAVYDFLRRLGFNWYMPTDLGIAFKPIRTLQAACMSVCRKPSMEFRHHEWGEIPADLAGDTVSTGIKAPGISSRELLLWFLRRRQGGIHRVFNHSLYLYYTRFPEKKKWFAQGYGKGRPPQLCYTNPEVIAQVVQDARDFFDRKVSPDKILTHAAKNFVSDAFPLWPMDNDNFCQCPECRKWLSRPSRRGAGMFSHDASSNYWYQFVNKVARELKKTHPGKKISTGAYASFAYPPDQVKLEDNVLVMICLHTRAGYAPRVQQNDRRILEDWTENYPRVSKYVWMYYCFPCLSSVVQQTRYFPNFFGGLVKDRMKFYYSQNVRGLFMEPSHLPHYQVSAIFDQLESYLTWELAFDRNQDPDRLYADFFRNYYGPAEKPMREFYELAQKWSNDPAAYPNGATEQNMDVAWNRIGTADRIARLKVLMEQARSAAVQDPFRSRLAVFERGVWQYICKGKKHAEQLESMRAPSMQQVSVPCQKNSRPGDALNINWDRTAGLMLYGDLKAGPLTDQLDVRVVHDGTWMYFRYSQKGIAPENVVKDQQVWHNDEWESFFARQRGVPYHQLAVDFHGQEHCEGVRVKGTLTDQWKFPGRITVKAGSNFWTVYIAVRLSEIVPDGIRPGEMLYYNVIRSHRAKARGCWIPTFAGYRAVDRLGEMYLESVPEN